MHCLGVEFGEVTDGRMDPTFRQNSAALVILNRAHGKGSWAQFQGGEEPLTWTPCPQCPTLHGSGSPVAGESLG